MPRKPKPREEVLASIKSSLESSGRFDDEAWQRFSGRLHLTEGDATSSESLADFRQGRPDPEAQLIIYLAIPPTIFEGVCKAFNGAKLVDKNTLIVVEKPLGTDKASFQTLQQSISDTFDESQVYRIDHYLGKESVQNLMSLRFANIIFGAIWNGTYIDNVQITISETVGVEDRHEFYENTGALRDMVQNHMLQLLCLVAMEPPANRSSDMIRAEKLKVLHSLKPITLDKINDNTVRGQYAAGSVEEELVPGYRQELGENSESDTETFVAIRAEIENWRWAGVPFYLRTGKRMSSRCAEVIIQFKNPKHNMFPDQMQGLAGNQLRIRLQPDEGIELHFLTKQPGLTEQPMESVKLDLQVPDSFKQYSFDAYARLMQEVLRNDQTLFVSTDEVVASWQWIDPIIEHWQTAKARIHPYTAGTMGPSQAVIMLAKTDQTWIDLSR